MSHVATEIANRASGSTGPLKYAFIGFFAILLIVVVVSKLRGR